MFAASYRFVFSYKLICFFFFIFNFFYPYFTSSKKERKNIKSFFTVILTLWWNNNIPVLAQTPSCVKVKSIFCCQWFTVIMAAAMLWWHTHTSVTSQSQRAGRRRLQRHEGRCWNMDEDIKVETLWDSGTGLTVYREKRQKAKGLFFTNGNPSDLSLSEILTESQKLCYRLWQGREVYFQKSLSSLRRYALLECCIISTAILSNVFLVFCLRKGFSSARVKANKVVNKI